MLGWGQDSYGQLGNGATVAGETTPEVVDELSSEALTPAGTTRFIEQAARET